MYAQRMFRMGVLGLAAMAILPLGTRMAKAEFIITFSQDGASVEASGTGSLNLSGLSLYTINSGTPYPFVDANAGTVAVGTVPPGSTDVYTGTISGPATFGSGGNTIATSGAGTAPNAGGAGIDASVGELFIPGGYDGGTFTVNSTWDGTTISDLGLTPGTYTWTWGSETDADSLEVIIPATAASVPEPSSLGIFCLGGLVLVGAMRGKNRATA
jgi:hypothetical protein